MTCKCPLCVCFFCSLIYFPNKYCRKSATVDVWSGRGRLPAVKGERCSSCAMQRSWGHVQSGWLQTSALSSLSVPWGSWMSVVYHYDCCQASTCPFFLTTTLKIKSGPINKSTMHHYFILSVTDLLKKVGWQQKSTLQQIITCLKKPSPILICPLFTRPALFPCWPFCSRLSVSHTNAHILRISAVFLVHSRRKLNRRLLTHLIWHIYPVMTRFSSPNNISPADGNLNAFKTQLLKTQMHKVHLFFFVLTCRQFYISGWEH